MKPPTDLADATARALDLLPPDDPAASDPRLVRHPELAREARLTRDTAAAVWLAVAPLRVAPPEILPAVMARISPAGGPARNRLGKLLPWLAATGWAAAAALLALLLWPQGNAPDRALPVAAAGQGPGFTVPDATTAAPAPPARDHRQQQEIRRLQATLAKLTDAHATDAPRVISLSPPGSPRPSPAETRQRVMDLLTHAIATSLEADLVSPTDPSSLVIERGWLPDSLAGLGDDAVVRHRHFPERAWQELGFIRSPEGAYYDPASKTLWTPAPDARGFLGRKASASDDLAQFTDKPAPDPAPTPAKQAEAFLVSDPATGLNAVAMNQALASGKVYLLSGTTALGGHFANPPVFGNMHSVNAGMGDQAVLLPLTINGQVTSLTITEQSLVPDGQAPRVILAGEDVSR